MSPQTRRSFIAAIGTTVAIAGCLGNGGSSGPTDTPTLTATEDVDDHEHAEDDIGEMMGSARVSMWTDGMENHFEPHVVWIEPGGTVTWELESGVHSATAYHPVNDRPARIPEGAESFDSGLVSEVGVTFTHTFDQAGVYDYFCLPHESTGMVGSVLVGEPDPHDQPGLAAAQSSIPAAARDRIAVLNEVVETALEHHD